MTTLHVHTPPPRTSTSRALARSLLLEALALRRPVAVPVAPSGATPRAPRWTVERCCAALRAFVAQHTRLPHQAEWRRARRHGLPSQGIIRKLFGGQNALTDAVGQRPGGGGRLPGPRPVPGARRPGRPYMADHLQAILAAFVTHHGRLPTRREWRASGRHRLPDPGTIRRHYGSLEALYMVMGMALPPRPTGNQYTAKEETIV